ncbi:FMN-binding protein [Pseudomaricurvus alcaniphilus]|uniref:FMN-binding protein n=1 Tax=Pseudomaricurvus alcaniphilus TaxID=1166482 RepID=UPI001A9F55E8|nr:FMN-binding protein [Pseudomaricurvus alcaniphilus]
MLILVLVAPAASAQRGVFLTTDEFRQRAFPAAEVVWQTLWVNAEQRQHIEAILGRKFPTLRIRYWGMGQKTAWIFEEIGKELPITIGVVVDAGQVAETQVLEYRESRGGEIRYPFFTSQFQGLQLGSNDSLALDGHIDGITGATLSVRAMTKIVTLALFCHRQTPFSGP